MNEIEFYKITKEMLKNLADKKGIKNLERYYNPSTCSENSIIMKRYSEIPQVFAQIAFHAQNATMISKIVNFESNIDFLDKVFCSFEPKKFLIKYEIEENREEEIVKKLIEKLKYTDDKKEGLKWNSEKNKTDKKDYIIRRFVNTMIDAAFYLKNYKTREQFLKDLKEVYGELKDYKKLINDFRNNHIKHGYSIALTCDFLKEFDETFIDLPKPDVHIKDTLMVFKGIPLSDFDCIKEMQNIVKAINEKLPKKEQITVYQLDRMIWLICSNNFFLDDIENSKNEYLKELEKKNKER